MISLLKKSELLTFEFLNENNEYITTSQIFGRNFSYLNDKNTININIDLENSNDIDEFLIFFKELKSIKLNSIQIIKRLAQIKRLNPKCIYFLKLNLNNHISKKYKLSFYYDGIKLHLKTKYIKE